MKTRLLAPLALSLLAAIPGPATAATVVDSVGDFLPSYTGPHAADLDVTSFSVAYNSISLTFLLSASFAGAIDPTTSGFYVIGANTGLGAAAPFGPIGAPNVRFDQVILLNKNGTGTIGANTLNPGNIFVAGNTISAVIPLGLLPATVLGFLPQNYGFNIWPRSGPGNATVISDFAPDNATLASLAAVPEPATWALMLFGFLGVGLAVRRNRAVRPIAAAV